MDQQVRTDLLPRRCNETDEDIQMKLQDYMEEAMEHIQLGRDRVCYGCLVVCDWCLQMTLQSFCLLGGINGRHTSHCLCLPSGLGQAQPNTS